jgi:hypothetical protein
MPILRQSSALGRLTWQPENSACLPGEQFRAPVILGRGVGITEETLLDERNTIAGVGPITVYLTVQNRAIGRRLMGAMHERPTERNFSGVLVFKQWLANRAANDFDEQRTVQRIAGAFRPSILY